MSETPEFYIANKLALPDPLGISFKIRNTPKESKGENDIEQDTFVQKLHPRFEEQLSVGYLSQQQILFYSDNINFKVNVRHICVDVLT